MYLVQYFRCKWLRFVSPNYCLFILEETECIAAWCSVDNWQPPTYGVYFYRELKESNKERQVVLFGMNTTM